MLRLCKKRPHGVSAVREQACLPRPQRSKGSTFKNQVLLIPRSTTVASQAHSVSPVNMSSASKTTSSNRQAMASKPKLQKALHAPTRNRQMTITATKAVWPKPLLISAENNTQVGAARGQYKAALPMSCNCTVKASARPHV